MRIELNSRQRKMIKMFYVDTQLSAKDLLDQLLVDEGDVSRPTVNRDLELLVELNILEKRGSGPSVVYSLSTFGRLNSFIEPSEYFQQEIDERNIINTFNWQVFDLIESIEIFSKDEISLLTELRDQFRKQREALSETLLLREIERVTIELSWKSSKIEGNTYTLLETENLIKNGIEGKGKSSLETKMVLNHKNAIKYIFSFPEKFNKISRSNIIELHAILTEGLDVPTGFRRSLVGITGTNYKPLDNQPQIEDAIDKMCDLVNKRANPFEKSFLAMLFISYIQAFEDGNKRTSRILGNAILLAHQIFPLSFRTLDDGEYKEGVLLFYEQNNIYLFKQLFLEQAIFSAQNYFRSSHELL